MGNSQLLQLKFFSRNAKAELALSHKWFENWGLRTEKEIPITFGHRTVPAKIARHNGPENEIWISCALAEKLLIPYPDPLWVKMENNTLSIGPVIGIATFIPAKGLNRIRNLLRKFLMSQKTTDRSACLFVFDIREIDWDNLTVEGYFLRKDGDEETIERKAVPFPDVIYNKLFGRNRENSPESLEFYRNLFNLTRCRIFNERYFHKWDVYERLKTVNEVRQWLPETHANLTTEKIQALLKRYHMIYLKPAEGYMGLGIYQLYLENDGKVIARFRQEDRNIARRFPSLKSFLRREFSGYRLNRYLAQQGIHLIQINGHPVDFRVHLNKNRLGEWEITGIGAKMAGKGSVTTHVRTGGKVLSPMEALQEAFGDLAVYYYRNLWTASIAIAEALDSTLGSPLGELGLDMGIDEEGRVWMFEANSKPGKTIFKIDDLKGKDLYATGLILDFSIHLAKFA